MTDESFPHVFHYGVGERRIRAKLGGPLRVFTEDCFSGKLVAVAGKPKHGDDARHPLITEIGCDLLDRGPLCHP
jgi:hypothetical protein